MILEFGPDGLPRDRAEVGAFVSRRYAAEGEALTLTVPEVDPTDYSPRPPSPRPSDERPAPVDAFTWRD